MGGGKYEFDWDFIFDVDEVVYENFDFFFYCFEGGLVMVNKFFYFWLGCIWIFGLELNVNLFDVW